MKNCYTFIRNREFIFSLETEVWLFDKLEFWIQDEVQNYLLTCNYLSITIYELFTLTHHIFICHQIKMCWNVSVTEYDVLFKQKNVK